MAKVSVVGAGSWGTALAMLLCNNGHDTMLWPHQGPHSGSHLHPHPLPAPVFSHFHTDTESASLSMLFSLRHLFLQQL